MSKPSLTAGSWAPLTDKGGFISVKGLRDGSLVAVSGVDFTVWSRPSIASSTKWALRIGSSKLAATSNSTRITSSTSALTFTTTTTNTSKLTGANIQTASGVLDIEQMADGTFLVLGTDRQLYSMANLNGTLVPLGVSDSIMVDHITSGSGAGDASSAERGWVGGRPRGWGRRLSSRPCGAGVWRAAY